jgi:hypothetical protein
MKAEIVNEGKAFQPFTLKIKVETEADLRILWNRFNIEFVCLSDIYKENSKIQLTEFEGEIDNDVYDKLEDVSTILGLIAG